jgi:hypothetical protein
MKFEQHLFRKLQVHGVLLLYYQLIEGMYLNVY